MDAGLGKLNGVGRGCTPVSPCARTLTGVCKRGIVAISRPLPVIPSAARNLKSMTARPVSLYLVDIMTNRANQHRNSPGRLYLRTDALDSSTPLRFAQNDSDGGAFSSMESGSIVKYIPLSAPGGGEIVASSSLGSSE